LSVDGGVGSLATALEAAVRGKEETRASVPWLPMMELSMMGNCEERRASVGDSPYQVSEMLQVMQG
jgi:hypothetical protein